MVPQIILLAALIVLPLVVGTCLAYAGYQTYQQRRIPLRDLEGGRNLGCTAYVQDQTIELRDMERLRVSGGGTGRQEGGTLAVKPPPTPYNEAHETESWNGCGASMEWRGSTCAHGDTEMVENNCFEEVAVRGGAPCRRSSVHENGHSAHLPHSEQDGDRAAEIWRDMEKQKRGPNGGLTDTVARASTETKEDEGIDDESDIEKWDDVDLGSDMVEDGENATGNLEDEEDGDTEHEASGTDETDVEKAVDDESEDDEEDADTTHMEHEGTDDEDTDDEDTDDEDTDDEDTQVGDMTIYHKDTPSTHDATIKDNKPKETASVALAHLQKISPVQVHGLSPPTSPETRANPLAHSNTSPDTQSRTPDSTHISGTSVASAARRISYRPAHNKFPCSIERASTFSTHSVQQGFCGEVRKLARSNTVTGSV